MKALSLWQPWAELVRRGLKQYETRDWPMPAWILDKPLAIHAAQRPFNSAHCPAELRCQLLMDEVDPFTLRYGVMLCIVHPQKSAPAAEIAPSLSTRERMYGNFAAVDPESGKRRFATRLDDVRVLPDPIAAVGRQGFFEWPEGDRIYPELW